MNTPKTHVRPSVHHTTFCHRLSVTYLCTPCFHQFPLLLASPRFLISPQNGKRNGQRKSIRQFAIIKLQPYSIIIWFCNLNTKIRPPPFSPLPMTITTAHITTMWHDFTRAGGKQQFFYIKFHFPDLLDSWDGPESWYQFHIHSIKIHHYQFGWDLNHLKINNLCRGPPKLKCNSNMIFVIVLKISKIIIS